MTIRFLLLVIFSIAMVIQHAGAAELMDINADTEDLTNESDAAVAETADVKARLAAEKAEAQRRHNAAAAANKAAVAKRQAAVDQMKKTENEIQRLGSEAVRLKGDIERVDKETATAEKSAVDNRAHIEKMNGELQALQDLRKEKSVKLQTIAAEQEKVAQEAAALDAQKAEQEKEFQALKDKEKAEQEKFDKAKLEFAQKRARLETYIATMKERHNEAKEKMNQQQAQREEMDRQTQMLDAQARTAAAEVQRVESQSSGGKIASAASDLTFTRKCRIFDGPTKGSKVLGIQSSGASVSKTDEGSSWIAFPLSDGRKGFVAKNCFR